jgi:hypothetical protein
MFGRWFFRAVIPVCLFLFCPNIFAAPRAPQGNPFCSDVGCAETRALLKQMSNGFWPIGYGAVYLADTGSALGLFITLYKHAGRERQKKFLDAVQCNTVNSCFSSKHFARDGGGRLAVPSLSIATQRRAGQAQPLQNVFGCGAAAVYLRVSAVNSWPGQTP